MPTLNEVKEQIIVVKSVGNFTNALQQIATMRMMQLRSKVLKSRPFVELANQMLSELVSLRNQMDTALLMKIDKKHPEVKQATPTKGRRAVIIITSNQGLSGSYNTEIYKRVERLMITEKGSDFYIIGKKGQEYYGGTRFKIQSYPYEVVDNFTIEDLKRLIAVFDYYEQLTLVYSRFINTATRDVVATSIVNPIVAPADPTKNKLEKPIKYTFEPDINRLINGVSKKLRAALFQQQIFDARLSQFAAQMVGMQAASENANKLLTDLQLDYNKARRKMIDKKISEVFAGSATWQG